MKFSFSLLLALLSLMATSVIAANVHIYSQPDGLSPNDAIRQAREMRRLHQLGVDDTLYIHMANGVYHLSEPLMLRPEDSGTPTSPTIIMADQAGLAVFSGGVDMEMKPRTEMPSWWSCYPVVGHRNIDVRQLWRGDDKVPHSSLVPLDSLITMVDFCREDRSILIPRSCLQGVLELIGAARLGFADDAESMERIKQKEIRNMEMIVHQRWAMAILRVKDFQIEGENIRVTFLDPESRLEFEHPWPQPVIREDRGDGVLRTSGFNLLGGYSLSMPGTWYQDNNTGELYYCAEDYERQATAGQRTFTIPVLHQLLCVNGTLERSVHDIIFQGISFQHTAWTRPSEQGHVTLQGGMYLLDAYKLDVPGLPEKDYLENQAWIERPEAAITVRGAQRVDFLDCDFRHLGATGLDYVWADSECKVRGCHFEDIGGTALALGAFPDQGFETHVPYKPSNMRELCSDIRIEYNLIENATNEDWGCVGIGAGYVSNVTISDNELRELNYSGICVGWGWTPLNSGMYNNRILRNHVHHFAKMLYDAGGIYTLSYQPGSSIEDNLLTDIYPPRYATNLRGFYIYLDEASDGFLIRNNACSKLLFGTNRPGADVQWIDNRKTSKHGATVSSPSPRRAKSSGRNNRNRRRR